MCIVADIVVNPYKVLEYCMYGQKRPPIGSLLFYGRDGHMDHDWGAAVMIDGGAGSSLRREEAGHTAGGAVVGLTQGSR